MTDSNLDPEFSISELAAKFHMTRQAIFKAVQKGKLIARQENGIMIIKLSDYNLYRISKHNRLLSTFNGEPLYDESKKEMSVVQAAKMFGKSYNDVHYLIVRGKLPHYRKGKTIILLHEDLVKIFTKEEKKSKQA